MDELVHCMMGSCPPKQGCELCSSKKAQRSIANGNRAGLWRGKQDRTGIRQFFPTVESVRAELATPMRGSLSALHRLAEGGPYFEEESVWQRSARFRSFLQVDLPRIPGQDDQRLSCETAMRFPGVEGNQLAASGRCLQSESTTMRTTHPAWVLADMEGAPSVRSRPKHASLCERAAPSECDQGQNH